MKHLLLLFIFFLQIASAFSLEAEKSCTHLRTRLQRAQKGDYIVTEANKIITLLAVRDRSESSVVFEEISIPAHHLKEKPESWGQWIKNKAPGHTSWSMVEIDLSNNQLLECYSFSRSAWLQVANQESLLSTILHLPLNEVAKEDRKKIGPAPEAGEIDRRQTWNPPLTVNGQKIERTQFNAYNAEWPKDNSELSGKTVTLYFDEEEKFPFPYWIQVDASFAAASIRVIDSGSKLPSPYTKLPRRVPEFTGKPRLTEKGLQMSLKSPRYYRNFELFAIDISSKEKLILPISHLISAGPGETCNLEIPQTELSQTLEPGHRYTWLLVPIGYGEYYTESTKPFLWNP